MRVDMGWFDTDSDSDSGEAAPPEGVGFISSRECVAEEDAAALAASMAERRSYGIIADIKSIFSNNATQFAEVDCTVPKSIGWNAEEERSKKLTEQMKKDYLGLADFEILRTLGIGTFSTVRLARHRSHGTLMAIKVMPKKEILRLNQLSYIFEEKRALTMIANRSPFVVQLEAVFQDDVNCAFAMQYLGGGELLQLISEGETEMLKDSEAAFYLAQVILGVEALHSLGWVHRDIKPENVVLSNNGYCKLGDLGFCKQIGHGRDKRTFTSLGTPEYMPPEIIQALGHGKSADLWCLGVLLFEMVNGTPPFQSDDPFEVYQLSLKLNYHCVDAVSTCATELIEALLQRVPDDRLGARGMLELKEHSFFSDIDWGEIEDQVAKPPVYRTMDLDDPGKFFLTYPEIPIDTGGSVASLPSEKDQKLFVKF